MLRTIGVGLLTFTTVIGVSLAIRFNYAAGLTLSPANIAISPPGMLSTTTASFAETGILIFYPNNVGPVPYLLYYDEEGNPYTKALVFAEGALSRQRYTYRAVEITGAIVHEHVNVATFREAL